MPCSVKFRLVVFILGILLLIPLAGHCQDTAYLKPCPSLSNTVYMMLGLVNTMAPLEKGAGWARWGINTNGTEIYAAATEDTARSANVLLMTSNNMPIVTLGAISGSHKYCFCRIRAELCDGYQISAWSSQNDGYVDRVKIISVKGEDGFAADLNHSGRISLFACPVLDSAWNILLLDSTGTEPILCLIYTKEKCIFGAEIPSQNGAIRDIYCSNSDGSWLGYVLDTIGVNIIGLTIGDSLFGKINRGIFDLTGDGQFDALLEYSTQFSKYVASGVTDQPKDVIDQIPEVSELIGLVSQAIERWNNFSDVIRDFNAIGFVMPEVLQLPE